MFVLPVLERPVLSRSQRILGQLEPHENIYKHRSLLMPIHTGTHTHVYTGYTDT